MQEWRNNLINILFITFLIILTISLFYPSFSQALSLDLAGYIGGQFNDYQVVGEYAYIATENGLQILDISNPASPSLKSTYNHSDYLNDVFTEGSIAYIATNKTGIIAVDTSNPKNVKALSAQNISDEPQEIYFSGNNAPPHSLFYWDKDALFLIFNNFLTIMWTVINYYINESI